MKGYTVFMNRYLCKGATVGLLSFFLFSACNSNLEPEMSENNEKIPINWTVQTMEQKKNDSSSSRALIDEYADLRDACTYSEYHEVEKIGLFGSYEIDGISTSVFNNEDLWWWEKEDGNPYLDVLGNDNHWNYEGEDRYWEEGANYTFRAYYPKSKVILQPGSSVNQLLTVYDTQQNQFDLMVATKTMEAKAENPVQLEFKHALAALKFDFMFVNEGVVDHLTACWLENVQSNGLYTSSTLNYSTSIHWPQSTTNSVGQRMYYWQPNNAPTIGNENHKATAYKSAASLGYGSLYTENDGWLLIIPQTCAGPESVNLCFKTSTGADVVYRAGLPAVIFEPGYRYNYHIKISSTEIKLSLTIADWNERKSSHDIDFNNQN